MPRFFRSSRFRRAVVGAALAVTAATVTYLMWPKGPHEIKNPLLVTESSSKHDEATYLSRHAMPAATCPAASTKCYHWDGRYLSGDLVDDLSGDSAVLSAVGTPQYQLHTPFARTGQGRTGWYFNGTVPSPDHVQAASGGLAYGVTASDAVITVAAVIYEGSTTAGTYYFFGDAAYIGGGGTGIAAGVDHSNMALLCGFSAADANWRLCASPASSLSHGWHYVACEYTRVSGTWSTVKAYIDDASYTIGSCGGTAAPTGDIVTGTGPTTIGAYVTGANPFQGTVAEVLVTTSVIDHAAAYQQVVNTGAFMTEPAETVAHYTMAETTTSSGTQDVSGGGKHLTVVTGTPTAGSTDLPYPMGSGFQVRSFGTAEGDLNYFEAPSDFTADYGPNDFSISFWYRHVRRITNSGFIITKRTTTGYTVDVDSATERLHFTLSEPGGTVSGVISDDAIPVGVWRYYTVNFDRDGNASAIIDNVQQTTVVDISSRQGSVSINAKMRLFRNQGVAGYDVEGALADLIIANGLTTLAEHQAAYRSFRVPDGVTYAQTTDDWKHPLKTVTETGERLAPVAAGQWPPAYNNSKSKHGFPALNEWINVVGYSNQIDLWTASGATVAADSGEAPDGSVSADEVTFSANGQYVLKGVVGGGSISAGERWCARLRYRRISGTCVGVNLRASSGTANTSFTDSAQWATLVQCDTQAAATKRAVVYATTHGSCKIELADAEYYQSDLPSSSCTNCTGNVNCVCNASYYSQDWSSSASFMPQNLERMEIRSAGVASPMVHTATQQRVMWRAGNYAMLAEGQQPSFELWGQGGGIEALVKGMPLQIEDEYRRYTSGWNLRDGLTNTTPRIYASVSMSRDDGTVSWTDTYQPQILDGRQNSGVEAEQTDVNSTLFTVGCDHNGANCYDGLIESAQLYARPAQIIRTPDNNHLISADFSGPAWLQRGYVPDLCAFDFGVASSNRWCWNMAEYGAPSATAGSIFDQVNGIELTMTGTPTFQINTGLLARGQGRKGLRSTDAGICSLTSNTGGDYTGLSMTWAVVYVSDTDTNRDLFGSVSNTGTASGWSITNTPSPQCRLRDAVGNIRAISGP
jgi:hypothetical protein